jgi:hypothetical protein
MPGFLDSIQVRNPLALVVFLVLWIVLYKLAHVLLIVWRREPLIGWAFGPFGLKLVALREPSLLYMWLDVFFPACVSGGTLYIVFFTSISPVVISHYPLVKLIVIVCGLLITSMCDLLSVLHDLRYPLWGEIRLLRTIQLLRTNWASIHFTPFGISYVRSHFDANPTELLQILSF